MSQPSSVGVYQGDVGEKLREWSSLIGIVTAIVGNVLISFALNIQRYAHIRLGREQEENIEQCNLVKGKAGQRSYGTQQSQIAEERVKFNLNAPLEEDGVPSKSQDGNDSNGIGAGNQSADYADSLRSRSSLDSTIKPSEKPGPQEDRKSYLKSGYWWTGIILMICGEAGNFLAYGFAPASIVSPLGVVALVSNCIIAPLLLKERFRQRDFWGVAIAIGGAVTIVLSAKNSEKKMGPDAVWAAITRWEFETYLGITAALIIILLWASEKYGEKTILIDLGLVGLFGMQPISIPAALSLNILQAATLLCPPKVLHLSYQTLSGAPLPSPSPTSSSSSLSFPRWLKYDTSTALYSALTQLKSSRCNLSSSRSLSSSVAPYFTETSRMPMLLDSGSSSEDVP